VCPGHAERLGAICCAWNLIEDSQPPLDASEVTYATLFLPPDASRHISGSTIPVDAGFMTKWRCDLLGREPRVYEQRGACHVERGVGGEVHDRLRHLDGLHQRRSLVQQVPAAGRGDQALAEVGRDLR